MCLIHSVWTGMGINKITGTNWVAKFRGTVLWRELESKREHRNRYMQIRESLKTELPTAKCSFCFCFCFYLRHEWHHTFFSVSRYLNQDLTRTSPVYTECARRNGQNFGRVFLMLNYTDITQNTYIQSWTVTEIMAIEKCGLLGCPRTVRRPWRHIHPLRMPGNEKPLANIGLQWPWRDNASAAACVNYLET